MTTPDPRCGKSAGYWAHRTRKEKPCRACTDAHTLAYQLRELDRMNGRPRWVDATASRQRLHEYMEAGLPLARFAQESNVDISTLRGIIHGYGHRGPVARVQRRTAEAIEAVAIPTHAERLDLADDRALLDATGTHRRIQALIAIGHSTKAIAKEAGIGRSTPRHALGKTTVTAQTARAIRDAHERLWDKPPVATTTAERRSISAVKGVAKRHGFAPTLAWDDIDDPTETPKGVPTATASVDVDLDEAARLLRTGEHPERVAARMGVGLVSLERKARRHDRRDILTLMGIGEAAA